MDFPIHGGSIILLPLPPAGVFLGPARKTRKNRPKGYSGLPPARRSPLEAPSPSISAGQNVHRCYGDALREGAGEGCCTAQRSFYERLPGAIAPLLIACNCGSTLLRCPAAASLDKASLRLADRCHSLPFLSPPPAAVGSLPQRLPSRFFGYFLIDIRKYRPRQGAAQMDL